MRKFILTFCLLFLSLGLFAQAIPVSLQYTEVYDFIDEIINDGIISHQSAVRPYTRGQIAQMLTEAQAADSLMDNRQKKALAFYQNVYALELDTISSNFVQYTDHKTFNLSLANPQFSYITKNKLFKMSLEPLLGMDIYGSKKGAIIRRWYGFDLRMDIAHHVAIWGSLRDNSWNGTLGLSKNYFPTSADKMYGARLNQGFYTDANGNRVATPALNMVPGTQYKEASYGGDFSDSKGGISLYAWFGSISVQRENIKWGDAFHCSNILSGRNPAVPMVSIQLTPCKWFQFDYFHAWLVSNVLDSTQYYWEEQTGGVQKKHYRPHSKYMAANMFTFTPIKYISFSLGNSIVYAESNPQAAYFIPFAFYKSLDHLLTKGVSSENQNSQAFASISIRPVEHLQLYGSFYLDEFSFSRWKPSNKERNPISYLVGFNWSNWPVKGFSLRGEFMRSNIACYTHSIEVLDFTSNGFNMGHYIGDNAQSINIQLAYRPIRGLRVQLSYTNDMKFNAYRYLRVARDESGNKIEPLGGISSTLAQKPFNKLIFRNDEVTLEGVYEVHPDMYIRMSFVYNNARGYDNTVSEGQDPSTGATIAIPSEILGTATENLNRYCPAYYQGSNLTFMLGMNFGF